MNKSQKKALYQEENFPTEVEAVEAHNEAMK
jgi:hypothetical protein